MRDGLGIGSDNNNGYSATIIDRLEIKKEGQGRDRLSGKTKST